MSPPNRKAKKTGPKTASLDAANPVAGVRIIGGRFRGRRIQYSGDIRTRPMKDRLREAIFNLIGPSINGKHVLDLFAGTGALALEALGRGARATLIEIHFPTATIIRQNAALLGVEGQTQVVAADTFIWCEQHLINPLAAKPSTPGVQSRPGPGTPWAVFCSPPYEFYAGRREDMLGLIEGLIGAAPAESLFVVEADARFDFALLPQAEGWRVRSYPPAQVGIFRKP